MGIGPFSTGIGLFKRPYTIRRHGPESNVGGYTQAKYEDFITRLNVQPQAPHDFEANPEGDRTVKHLKSWGPDMLISADEYTGTPGDLLYYHGLWYECKSSAMWDHTILSHYQSDFVALPATEQTKHKQPGVTPP